MCGLFGLRFKKLVAVLLRFNIIRSTVFKMAAFEWREKRRRRAKNFKVSWLL